MNTVDPFTTNREESAASPWRKLLWEEPDRRVIMVVSVLAAMLFIGFMTLILNPHGRFAGVLLDRDSPHFKYPFTIQNIEHVLLFLGLGELYCRWRSACHELSFLEMNLLPEDEETVLEAGDLGPIRKRVSKLFNKDHGILPSLIDLSILQFQSGRSIDQAVSVMNSNLELVQHRVDLSYSLIRYIAWVIPTTGFIGTVVGIGGALASVGDEIIPKQLSHQLAVGFDCTLVALVESAVLVFILHMVQEKEELAINHAGSYTLRNLINRLFTSR